MAKPLTVVLVTRVRLAAGDHFSEEVREPRRLAARRDLDQLLPLALQAAFALPQVQHATLAVADRNMAHNDGIPAVRACVHETMQQDAFQALRDLAAARRRFDLVVIDPPSFAQRQSNVDKALRAYRQLTEAGLAVLADGGRLVQASCSSRVRPDELVAAMTRGAQLAGWDLNIRERTGHPADHPIGFPEGEYLKAVFAAPRRLPRDARP